MLVLTRKVGEKINIGGDIIVNVLEINKGSVRLGVEAPRNISILRHQVYERIREENLKSAQGSSVEIEKAARRWREKDLKG